MWDGSPLLVEMRVEVDSDGGTVVSRLVSDRVRIHGIDVVVGIVHNNDLGVSSLSTRGDVLPDVLRCDFAVFGEEVALEAGLVINVGFPDHAGGFGVSVAEVPVGVIVNVQLSVGVFDNSVGVVDA